MASDQRGLTLFSFSCSLTSSVCAHTHAHIYIYILLYSIDGARESLRHCRSHQTLTDTLNCELAGGGESGGMEGGSEGRDGGREWRGEGGNILSWRLLAAALASLGSGWGTCLASISATWRQRGVPKVALWIRLKKAVNTPCVYIAECIFRCFDILLPPLFLLVSPLTLSLLFLPLSLSLLSLEISYAHALPLLVPCLGLRCCLTGSCSCLCSESSNDPCWWTKLIWWYHRNVKFDILMPGF